MNSRATQIDNRFDNQVAENAMAAGLSGGLDAGVDCQSSARPGIAQMAGIARLNATFAGMPLGKLLFSPNLRAAVAIGFFLAYLATALS